MSETEASAPAAASGSQQEQQQPNAGKQANKAQQQPTGPKLGSNKWMEKVYNEKPPFPAELFETIFTTEKLQALVAALKTATEKEVAESKRLLESDYTYSLMISSWKIPHVAVHLSRM